MQRIRNLNLYQKGLLIVMLAMALVFAAVYRVTVSRVGFSFQNVIFVPAEENGTTVYSGKLRGEQAQFRVSEKQTVVFRYGEKTYGPYTVKEDAQALAGLGVLPNSSMKGVEIREGETLGFRGGFWQSGEDYWLENADGGMFFPEDDVLYSLTVDGVKKEWNVGDPAKPSLPVILQLAFGPELTHKGELLAWFAAVFISVINMFTILYADELFRWNLSFQIQNVQDAEPSGWEMMTRYLGWTLLTVAVLVIYIAGLR